MSDAIIAAVGSAKDIKKSIGLDIGELAYAEDTHQLFSYNGNSFSPVSTNKTITTADQDYEIKDCDEVVVLLKSCKVKLPKSNASGRTLKIINDGDEKSVVVVSADGEDLIAKSHSELLHSGEYIDTVDYSIGKWL
jgi:hypothetical protein